MRHERAALNGFQIDARSGRFPSLLSVLVRSAKSFSPSGAYIYGFVTAGTCRVEHRTGLKAELSKGMYFALNSGFEVSAEGAVVFIERAGYQGFNQIGGPVEPEGRQSYIDGCRSSLLVSPAHMGDPCLNLLTFPPHVRQSAHTHPSIRMGTVYSGSGLCVTDARETLLTPGDCFLIEAGERHCFRSGENGLSVIAYHPDSDWGPTDESHPMLNRTFVCNP